MKIALGADHAGVELVAALREVARSLGHEIIDLSPPAGVKVDYPVSAHKVCRALLAGEADRGVLVCGSGIGISMAANKLKGIRAALVHDAYTARMSRLHNDANVLCMGARVIGDGVAADCLEVFLATAFEGGRHSNRVAMFSTIENGGEP